MCTRRSCAAMPFDLGLALSRGPLIYDFRENGPRGGENLPAPFKMDLLWGVCFSKESGREPSRESGG